MPTKKRLLKNMRNAACHFLAALFLLTVGVFQAVCSNEYGVNALSKCSRSTCSRCQSKCSRHSHVPSVGFYQGISGLGVGGNRPLCSHCRGKSGLRLGLFSNRGGAELVEGVDCGCKD